MSQPKIAKTPQFKPPTTRTENECNCAHADARYKKLPCLPDKLPLEEYGAIERQRVDDHKNNRKQYSQRKKNLFKDKKRRDKKDGNRKASEPDADTRLSRISMLIVPRLHICGRRHRKT